MLNYIWLGLILCAIVIGGVTGRMKEVSDGAFTMARMAVMDVALPLVGVMALWLGIMRLAEKSGMVQLLARLLRPLMTRLFPDVPADHPAMGSMLMNIAANMLGLSNAATPLGIRAMNDLEALNPRPGIASNAMCTFLAINTSSVQLIPATAVGVLVAYKSKDPTSIIGPSFLSSLCAFVAAITAVKLLEKLPWFRLPPVSLGDAHQKTAEARTPQDAPTEPIRLQPIEPWGYAALAAYFLLFAVVFVKLTFAESLHAFVPEGFEGDKPVIRIVKVLSLLSIPAMLSFFPLYAAIRRIKVYDEFVEGAKEGFQIIVKIIPYLVTILVAIGMFRGAGGIELITNTLRPVMGYVHFPPELIPMALIRPLSGSGSLGVFTDMVKQYGPDHIFSRMAGTMYGSTETTFYVLAVYFGAVNIKRTRHAVLAGLVPDLVAIIASVKICRMVFG
jgi:spore maturation protein SpmA